MTDKQYPELPDFEAVEQHIYGACRRYISQDMLEPIHNLIRDGIDADRAMRAAQAESVVSLRDNLRPDLIADLREVFDPDGPEAPQIIRDVIEYTDAWLSVYIQKRPGISVQPQEAAPAAQGEPSGTERNAARYLWLRERVGFWRGNDGKGPVSWFPVAKVPASSRIQDETDAAIDQSIAQAKEGTFK